MRPNVRMSDTGIVHEHALTAGQVTRCGLRYLRDRQYTYAYDFGPIAFEARAEIDCMACIVTPETEHADLREVIVANSVKDLTEAEDASAIGTLMGKVTT